jgi:phosphotransferase system HPr-like phosphotransfer protein
MTDEEADAKHASSMAAIVAALKAEYGDRVKTVKIGGEKAEDLVQAIKEIDPTADVEVSDK